MNILLFLAYWSVRVFEWFASLYPNGREIVIRFMDYLHWAVNQAINASVGYVNSALANIIGFVQSVVSNVWSIAVSAAQSVLNGFYSVVYGIRDWLVGFIYGIRDWLVNLYHQAIAYASAIRAQIESFVQGLINNAISYIQSSFRWVYDLQESIRRLISIFSPNNIAKFIDFLERIYPELLLFLSNPIFYILDLIKDKFISFFCMVIAYGIGTTKYELPPFAKWKEQ